MWFSHRFSISDIKMGIEWVPDPQYPQADQAAVILAYLAGVSTFLIFFSFSGPIFMIVRSPCSSWSGKSKFFAILYHLTHQFIKILCYFQMCGIAHLKASCMLMRYFISICHFVQLKILTNFTGIWFLSNTVHISVFYIKFQS